MCRWYLMGRLWRRISWLFSIDDLLPCLAALLYVHVTGYLGLNPNELYGLRSGNLMGSLIRRNSRSCVSISQDARLQGCVPQNRKFCVFLFEIAQKETKKARQKECFLPQPAPLPAFLPLPTRFGGYWGFNPIGD